MPTRVKIAVGEVELEGELFDTECAEALASRLPLRCGFNTWGDEIYFEVPLVRNRDETATMDVDAGTIAYWPSGRAVCLFFGPTPMSSGSKPVPADRVNIIGRLAGDATVLKDVKGASHLEMGIIKAEEP